MWRNVVRLCAPWLLAATALAQQKPIDPALIVGDLEKQSTPLVQAWLHHPDPRYQAWGTYLVLRDRHTEAIPDLLNMLAAYQSEASPSAEAIWDQHRVMLGVLDALIQLEAAVPLEDARRIYPAYPVQALILMSRSSEDSTPALFDIFKTEQRHMAGWRAAGNFLLQRKAEGFVAAVISGMTVHADVWVTDPNAGAGGSFGGGNLCCMAAGRTPPLSGWPPLGVYSFAHCGRRTEPGAILLAAGADPAYYHRQATDTYHTTVGGGCDCGADTDLVRQHYISTLLWDSPVRPSLPAQLQRNIEWRSPESYLTNLAAVIAEQQSLFSYTAYRLRQQNLLSESESPSTRPRLQITTHDVRSSRDTPLPVLAPLPENVTVESN